MISGAIVFDMVAYVLWMIAMDTIPDWVWTSPLIVGHLRDDAYASVLFKNFLRLHNIRWSFEVSLGFHWMIDFSTISQMTSEGDKGGIALGTHGPFFCKAICTGWHG